MLGFGVHAFGLELRWAPAAGLQIKRVSASPVPSNRGGWWPIIREPFAGAWQRDVEWTTDTVLAHHAVYTCITLISNDVGKLRPKLVEQDADGIWSEVQSAAFSPVLKKPNRYQNRIQFLEWWIISKLTRGNTYTLKERDARGVVRALYLLDPQRVTVLVAPDGGVYYDLQGDNLSGVIEGGVQVPASEIIHDRMNCLFHPLVGVSPIYAAGTAANIGLKIQSSSANFFARGANPSGVLSAPATIPKETAERLKEFWEREYSGENAGSKVAVLGDGLKWEPMRMTAVDAQTIEQLKWTAETVCSTFHVPPWKAHVGAQPAYTSPQIANQIYYSDCLQSLIEQWELCMDEGLGLDTPKEGKTLGVELDVDAGLLRMDTASQVDTLTKGIRGGLFTPNGARQKIGEKPLYGGNTIYLQHQDYPMEQVFDRTDLDSTPPATAPPATPVPEGDDPGDDDGDTVRALSAALTHQMLREAA